MWRKFLGVGIPFLVVGLILYIVGARQVSISLFEYGGSAGGTALTIIGLLMAMAGFMLVNAGLIGAAVGADLRSRLEASGSFSGTVTPIAEDVSAPRLVSTSGEMITPRKTPVYGEGGTTFNGVDGLSLVFIPASRDYFSVVNSSTGDNERHQYRPSQLLSVELMEDYKSLSSMTSSSNAETALASLAEARPLRVVSSLFVHLNLDDSAYPRHTVWFHRGRTVESGSPAYARAWKEAVRCFAAVGALLPSDEGVPRRGTETASWDTPAKSSTAGPTQKSPTDAVSEEVRYCAMCGAQNRVDDPVCRRCGAERTSRA